MVLTFFFSEAVVCTAFFAMMNAGVSVNAACVALASAQLSAVVGAVGLGGIATYEVLGARELKTKTNRAIAYLQEIEANLKNLCKSLADVHASTKAFAAINERDDRVFIQERITVIIGELGGLIALCDKALESRKEKAKSSWCTIM